MMMALVLLVVMVLMVVVVWLRVEWRHEPGPALERGDGEEREHSVWYVVEVEVAVLPLARHRDRIVDVAAFIDDVLTADPTGRPTSQASNQAISQLL